MDWTKNTALFIGRFQPWKKAHFEIVKQAIQRGDLATPTDRRTSNARQIMIMVRCVEVNDKNVINKKEELAHSPGLGLCGFITTGATVAVSKNDSKNRKSKFEVEKGLKILKKNIVHEKNYWKINAAHDGYLKQFNSIHEREIEYYPEQMIFIGLDKIIKKKTNHNYKFDIRFHVEPQVKLMKTQDNKSILIELDLRLLPPPGPPPSSTGTPASSGRGCVHSSARGQETRRSDRPHRAPGARTAAPVRPGQARRQRARRAARNRPARAGRRSHLGLPDGPHAGGRCSARDRTANRRARPPARRQDRNHQ